MLTGARASSFLAPSRLFVSLVILVLSLLPASLPAATADCPKSFVSLSSSPLLRAIPELMELYAKSGGFTYNPSMGGNMSGRAFIAVSAFPERTLVLQGTEISEEAIRKYIGRNKDLLSHPQVSLGAWFDKESDRIYLDLSLTLPAGNKQQREAAVSLGRKFNQIAVYDLGKREEIKTMGNGAARSELPPIPDRLRQIESLR